MAVIKADYRRIDESIRKLKKASEVQAGKPSVTLSFRGDFTFTKSYRELNTLIEQNHILWYNAAGYEAALLSHIKQGLKNTDKVLSGLIGASHE